MTRNVLRHKLSQDELGEQAEVLLGDGFRLGLVAAHEDDAEREPHRRYGHDPERPLLPGHSSTSPR